MTLQSSFDLDILIKITTSSSQTIISARGLEEVFGLIQYSILALIGSFLANAGDKIDRVIIWLNEPIAWLEIAIYFSFSFTKEICRELAATAT
ncbi:MAG: hypothetical protein ACXADH_18645 [Candidatus Kariarchaeaceae archaeon]|jgi:hypothetical protein